MRRPKDLSASDATPEDLAASAVPKVWTDIVRYRANYGTGYLGTWFGLSHMSRRDRLQRMMARTQTQRVLQAIDGLSVGEVEHLQALANVNAERAQLAFRTTLILNFSSPFAVLIGLGQLFPATAKMVIRELRGGCRPRSDGRLHRDHRDAYGPIRLDSPSGRDGAAGYHHHRFGESQINPRALTSRYRDTRAPVSWWCRTSSTITPARVSSR